MEKKSFSKIEISVIKTTAKNAAQYVAKKNKVEAQIKEVEEKVAEQIRKRVEERVAKLEAEKASYQAIIESLNAPVKQITGGYTTEDLVEIKKEATGQMDANTGKEIFKTVYALKYPDTVVPPVENEETDTTEPECPTHEEEAPEEMPEEYLEEKAEEAAEVEEADPFGDVAADDPFNQ